MDICQSLVDLIKAELDPKEFSTGSRGFYVSGKITVDGVRYQGSSNLNGV
ncbi:hypothetical protein [Nonomuraea sp. NEAU-A123]|nr:hypothetical protein [Nonomuraea sp. NEAU-A123]MBT2235551.1 hypothetical protein [Nonomuraea sp. NEAU-A123]